MKYIVGYQIWRIHVLNFNNDKRTVHTVIAHNWATALKAAEAITKESDNERDLGKVIESIILDDKLEYSLPLIPIPETEEEIAEELSMNDSWKLEELNESYY